MFGLEKKLPGFIIHKRSIQGTTIFSGVFALAFINFYAPFGVDQWFHLSEWKLFLYSSLVILTGMIVIVLSRIILTQYKKKHIVTYLDYAIWIFIEIVSMAIFYSLFIKHVLHDTRLFFEIIQITIKNTALVLLIPYTVLWLYYAYQEKNLQLKKLEKMKDIGPTSDSMISFFDENGKYKLSVHTKDLLYLKASDNYVSIYYHHSGKINKYLIRNTLKGMEEGLNKHMIHRIHRSYMVNARKVKVLMREKENLQIVLDTTEEIVLPVSKTYISSVINLFSGETN